MNEQSPQVLPKFVEMQPFGDHATAAEIEPQNENHCVALRSQGPHRYSIGNQEGEYQEQSEEK